MQVFLSVPMLGISKHVGMSIGEFTTKHLRSGNFIFDIGPGCRRFIPQAMCLVEEFTDEEWDKREKAAAAAAKAEVEAKEAAEKRAADDEAAAKADRLRRIGANEAWKKKLILARLFTKKPYPEAR